MYLDNSNKAIENVIQFLDKYDIHVITQVDTFRENGNNTYRATLKYSGDYELVDDLCYTSIIKDLNCTGRSPLNKHENSRNLRKYFKEWLDYLNISESLYSEIVLKLEKEHDR